MKTFFIRFKSLLTLGLVLLSVSFVWFALTSYHQAKQIIAEEEVFSETGKTDNVTAQEIVSESKITIVPQENKEITDDFFSEYRLERERMRSEQLEILNEIINNPNSNAEAKSEAQEKLLWLTNNLGKETKIEKALLAKGFVDAAVAIESQAIMVIVPSEGLRQDEVAKIADIVIKIAECELEDVVIVPKGP
ncbi:MAG: SpoIIIAH-like family protein [Clostridia bacterium]|nr:SpoIIIAH-like family protein [Clostridia bacterium]